MMIIETCSPEEPNRRDRHTAEPLGALTQNLGRTLPVYGLQHDHPHQPESGLGSACEFKLTSEIWSGCFNESGSECMHVCVCARAPVCVRVCVCPPTPLLYKHTLTARSALSSRSLTGSSQQIFALRITHRTGSVLPILRASVGACVQVQQPAPPEDPTQTGFSELLAMSARV